MVIDPTNYATTYISYYNDGKRPFDMFVIECLTVYQNKFGDYPNALRINDSIRGTEDERKLLQRLQGFNIEYDKHVPTGHCYLWPANGPVEVVEEDEL